MPDAVLITGAAKRIGAAMAKYMAIQGYDVALHYHSSAREAQAVQKAVQKLGRKCELFQQDLSDAAAIPAFLHQVKKRMPNLNVLINSAGIFERGEFLESNQQDFDRHFDTNFKSPVFLTQAFAQQVGKGCVINLLDTNITRAHGSHFFYLLSKKALGEFTIMAAKALGPKIRVNAVCPGVVLPSSQNEKAYEQKVKAANPLKALAGVDDVCEAVGWLAAQKSITGQLLYVDGGQHIA